MKTLLPLLCIGLLSCIAINAHAGELSILKDDFDGTIHKFYQSSPDEASQAGLIYNIALQDHGMGSVIFSPLAKDGLSDCDRPIRIKDKNGIIHDFKADRISASNCHIRIPLSFMEHDFTVKYPMYGGTSDITAHFDTQSLKIDDLQSK